MQISPFYKTVGILAATTIGAGMFALPWVLAHVGWNIFMFLLLGLGLVVSFGQVLYWKVLERTGERIRLVGLARRYLNRPSSIGAFVAVLGGMLFALIAYLILGTQFLSLLLPFPPATNLIIFWLLAALPAMLSVRRFATVELWGTLAIALIIAFIFLGSPWQPLRLPDIFQPQAVMLGFGVILFALSGWNAIEPMHAIGYRIRPVKIMGGGLLLIAGLYLLFSWGILSWSGGIVSPDGISGTTLPASAVKILALLGLVAIWTSYIPAALEIQSVLKQDFRFRAPTALMLVLFLPLFLVFIGFGDLLATMSFAGAVFTGFQYAVIFMVARKALRLRDGQAVAAYACTFLFLLAAAFEVYQFFLR
jgi:tyrosine-specific transport protein